MRDEQQYQLRGQGHRRDLPVADDGVADDPRGAAGRV